MAITVPAYAWEVGVRDSHVPMHLNNEVFFTILSEDVVWSSEASAREDAAENKKKYASYERMLVFSSMLHQEA
jgi:hypothetical protein